MKRLKRLCDFFASVFSSMTSLLFIIATISRNVNFVILGIAMGIFCGIIVYNMTKYKDEKNWALYVEGIVIKY